MQSRILFICIAVFFLSSCAKTRITDHPDWSKYYEQYGIKNACFILRDNNHEAIHYYNLKRCQERLSPASTFKIFNSLVALETAVAPDDQLVIKWDSVKRREEWNKDMTMAEAMKVSCLPYYQEIARRVGPTKMKHFLDTVKYGNMKMEGKIDNFWINNSLQISADEQAGFVKRLYFAELPFSERSQRIVKNMMLREETAGYRLYYKTGTYETKEKTTYWVVGFAERIEHVKEDKESMNKVDVRNYPYFFAQNFDMPTGNESQDWYKVRLDIMRQLLKDYGAIKN